MKLSCSIDKFEKIIVDEAVSSLTQKPLKSTTFERVCLLHKANELYGDLNWQQRYSKSIYYLLQNCSTPVKDYDLILGRVEDKVLSAEEERVFLSLSANSGRPSGFRDGGHKSFYWKDLVEKGLTGLKNEALAQLNERKLKNDRVDKINFLSGVVTIYDALIEYARRYSIEAEKHGLTDASKVLDAITHGAPKSFREALQLLWLVQLVYCSYLAGNPSLCYGRLDLLLEDLYNRDIESGRLTKEDARLLILDYYCKNNLIMGRGEHQISAVDENIVTGWARNLCYDSPQYLYIGGHRKDGSLLDGELTHLFAETIVPTFKNPVILVRYSQNMQSSCPDLWLKIVEKMRESSSIIVYNEAQVIKGFEYIGVPREDAEDFEHYGCNHPTLPSIERVVNYSAIFPVSTLDEILRDWASKGFEPTSMDALYETFLEKVRQRTALIIAQNAERYQADVQTQSAVLEFADCFSRFTIPSASSHRGMGSKYFFVTFLVPYFASLVDCFSAIDTLVIKEKRLSLSRLMQAVEANFIGYNKEYLLCKKAPKLGSDDERANAIATTLMLKITDAIKEVASACLPKDCPVAEGYEDSVVKPKFLIRLSTESDNGHIEEGAKLGATVDGRKAGFPLSQNSSPAIGSSCNGLTARLSSLVSIPFDRFTAGAQNLSIQKSVFVGDEGLRKLASLLGTYFDMGGLQIQLTSVDTKTLKDAQINPDAHRDLLVRVTGYSAIFTDLGTTAQNDIISREEMK